MQTSVRVWFIGIGGFHTKTTQVQVFLSVHAVHIDKPGQLGHKGGISRQHQELRDSQDTMFSAITLATTILRRLQRKTPVVLITDIGRWGRPPDT